jgi:hypothetical protein
MAGDFCHLAPREHRFGSLETKANARKALISGPFSRFPQSLAERRSGWLGREDSNLRMVESKSGNFSNDLNEHSEKSVEFGSLQINGLAIDSE